MKPFTFGYAIRDARALTQNALADFATQVGSLASVEIVVTPLDSYDELTQRLHRGDLDMAWVPPLPLVSLVRAARVTPVATLHRDQLVHYRSAVVVASTSRLTRLEDVAGMRAAWVDPHSAAGYVLARIELARHGVGQTALGVETFFGSHDAVVHAVAAKRADFGATFARVARDGTVEGAWTQGGLGDSIRALGTFGEIPPDAIVLRATLDDALKRSVGSALVSESARLAVKRALGADAVRPFEETLYETFRGAVFRAYEEGVLNASAVLRAVSTDPEATTQHPSLVPEALPTEPELPLDDEDIE